MTTDTTTRNAIGEAAVRSDIRKELRKMGWLVIDTSQDHEARGGMAGFPDLVAFKLGRTLLIETKYGKNDLSERQRAFRTNLSVHLDPQTLMYCVARDFYDVLRALGLT